MIYLGIVLIFITALAFCAMAVVQYTEYGIVKCLSFIGALALICAAMWPPFALAIGFTAGAAVGLSDGWACVTGVLAMVVTLTAGCCLLDYSTQGGK